MVTPLAPAPPSFGVDVFTLEPAPHTHGYIHAIVFIMEIQASRRLRKFKLVILPWKRP